MSVHKRRQFLLSFPISLSGLTSLTMFSSEARSKSIRNEQIYELKRVYEVWTKTGLGDPSEYVANRSITFGNFNNLDSKLFKEITSYDFSHGFTLNVDGLVLSQYEAALLALYAKQCV